MKRHTLLLAAAAFALLGLGGCAHKGSHSPDETLAGQRTGAQPDWVDGSMHGDALSAREDWASDAAKKGLSADALGSVYFAFDSSAITADQREGLQSVYESLAGSPKAKILIVGHCDWRGTEAYNLVLGERRAKSVENYLSQLGLSKSRMETLSRGQIEAAPTGSIEDTWQDRRADVKIIK